MYMLHLLSFSITERHVQSIWNAHCEISWGTPNIFLYNISKILFLYYKSLRESTVSSTKTYFEIFVLSSSKRYIIQDIKIKTLRALCMVFLNNFFLNKGNSLCIHDLSITYLWSTENESKKKIHLFIYRKDNEIESKLQSWHLVLLLRHENNISNFLRRMNYSIIPMKFWKQLSHKTVHYMYDAKAFTDVSNHSFKSILKCRNMTLLYTRLQQPEASCFSNAFNESPTS